MIKPEDPLDPYDFHRQVNEVIASMGNSHVYVRFGTGDRVWRVVSVDEDPDGDMIITTEGPYR